MLVYIQMMIKKTHCSKFKRVREVSFRVYREKLGKMTLAKLGAVSSGF